MADVNMNDPITKLLHEYISELHAKESGQDGLEIPEYEGRSFGSLVDYGYIQYMDDLFELNGDLISRRIVEKSWIFVTRGKLAA